MIWTLFRSTHSAHAWVESEDGGTRSCGVCGERQEFVSGDELVGLYWETTQAGRKEAHALSSPKSPVAAPGLNLAAMIAPFKKLLNRTFPQHTWIETEQGMSRHCPVCGQEEELDPGCDLQGATWMIVQRGDKRAHAASNPSTAAPAVAPAPLLPPAVGPTAAR